MRRPAYRYADADRIEAADLRHALATWAELLIRAAERGEPSRPSADRSAAVAYPSGQPSK